MYGLSGLTWAIGRRYFLTHLRNFSVNIRNVAIVAHVDHGKTTLVDQLLKFGGEKVNVQRTMDSLDLERERGITITSKVTRINHKDTIFNVNYLINLDCRHTWAF